MQLRANFWLRALPVEHLLRCHAGLVLCRWLVDCNCTQTATATSSATDYEGADSETYQFVWDACMRLLQPLVSEVHGSLNLLQLPPKAWFS